MECKESLSGCQKELINNLSVSVKKYIPLCWVLGYFSARTVNDLVDRGYLSKVTLAGMVYLRKDFMYPRPVVLE